MQESTSGEAEEQAVDDPTWTSPDLWDDSDTEEENFSDPESPKKKRRRIRDKNKPAKLSKCPHCFREFTNLKHHINQQHSQVGQMLTYNM